jgi:hypothetical protein
VDYAYKFYRQLLNSGQDILGEVFSQHKAALAGSSTSNGAYRWIQFGLNYQGDPAIGAAPSPNAFVVHNDGTGDLEVTDITKQNGSCWLSFSPSAPFTVSARSSQTVTVTVDTTCVTPGTYSDRLLVYSNDPPNPYPGGVYVNLTKTCIADYNNDYFVDIQDLAILVNYWLVSNPSVDLTGDNFINFPDFAVFAEHWLEGVQP